MTSQFSLRRFIGISIILLLFGIFLDSYTTYLLFDLSYEDMLKYEFSTTTTQRVKEYGLVGVFYYSVDEMIAYFIVLTLGSFITGIFFFNHFKDEFDYIERVVIIIWIGVLVLATLKIGAGLNNLYCLIR
ncbi:MAG: hypothetical protein KKE96_04150 [Candidatus Altiarchaeota archaeon]|nr:hypothetical protein [Candidatus Altiarchaeota archaeon]